MSKNFYIFGLLTFPFRFWISKHENASSMSQQWTFSFRRMAQRKHWSRRRLLGVNLQGKFDKYLIRPLRRIKLRGKFDFGRSMIHPRKFLQNFLRLKFWWNCPNCLQRRRKLPGQKESKRAQCAHNGHCHMHFWSDHCVRWCGRQCDGLGKEHEVRQQTD